MKHEIVAAFFALTGLAACSPPAEQVAETPAPQQQADVDPAAYRGAAVAGQVCSQCHDVGMGIPPAQEIGAPDFRDIAGRDTSTAAGLAEWMRASHPKMPNYMFGAGEVPDLAAYIMSLRSDRN